jgi:thymidylate synthase
MHSFVPNFGYHIHGKTIGECWISLVEAIYEHGEECFDEDRKRKALFDVRLRSDTQKVPDSIIHKIGNLNNLKTMVNLMFKNPVMYDIDIVPSFSKGPKSYYQRLKKGKLLEFVISRLSKVPQSKKAIINFILKEDYKLVLKNPKDDYLPCLTTLQFRLSKDNRKLNVNAYFRSIDAFQKAHGNLEAIALLTKKISEKISQELFKNKTTIHPGYLDVIIADAHIYFDTLENAKKCLDKYRRLEHE